MMWSEETTAGDQGPAFSVYLMHSSRESNTFLNLGGFIDSVATWMRSELQPPNWFVLSDLKLQLSLTNKNPKNGMGTCWQSYYSLQPLLLWGVRKKIQGGDRFGLMTFRSMVHTAKTRYDRVVFCESYMVGENTVVCHHYLSTLPMAELSSRLITPKQQKLPWKCQTNFSH